jgi:hypothetical protein
MKQKKQQTVMETGLLWDLIDPGNDPVKEWNDFASGLNDIVTAVRKDYSFPQTGAKTGQTYFEHAIKGIHAVVQVYSRADLPRPNHDERSMKLFKIICLAYLVHDLNKLPWLNPWSKDKWNANTLHSELERINQKGNAIDAFLPGWTGLLNDMMLLINGHHKKNACRGNELLTRIDVEIGGTPISFDRHEIVTGIDIMRLVDDLDLLHHPSQDVFEMDGIDTRTGEEKRIPLYHDGFFKWIRELLSKITGREMELNTVRVIKESSRFTNVILNQAIDVLSNHGVYPLRVFTSGVVVFGEISVFNKFYDGERSNTIVMDGIINEIGSKFIGKIEDFMLRNESKLFDYASHGIDIKDFVFQEPNAKDKVQKVIEHLSKTIPVLSYDNSTEKKRKDSSRFKSVAKLDYYLDVATKNDPLIARWEGGYNDALMDDVDAWKMGRLAHTAFVAIIYIFKQWQEKNIDQVPLMKELLEHLGIFDRLSTVYDKPSSTSLVYRYYFFHLVGTALKESGKMMGSITKPIVDLLHAKMDEVSIDEPFINDPADFIRDHLQFFTFPSSSKDIIHPSHPSATITCTACGKKMANLGSKKKNEKAYKWKSQQVLDGVKVEKFSNFLVAGNPGKGVRMICHSCMWRHYLDTILASVSGDKIDTWHVTFYMEDGLPFDSIVSMKNVLERARINPDGFTSFRVANNDSNVGMKLQNGYGFMIPSIPDETCGSIVLEWKMKKSTTNEEFWDVMHDVLVMASTTRMRAVVTMLRNDYEDLLHGTSDMFFQDIPGTFKQLIGNTDSISFEKASVVIDIMNRVDKISLEIVKEISDKQTMNVKIASKLVNEGILPVIHAIEHGWDDDKKKKNSIARARYWNEIRAIHGLYLSLRDAIL